MKIENYIRQRLNELFNSVFSNKEKRIENLMSYFAWVKRLNELGFGTDYSQHPLNPFGKNFDKELLNTNRLQKLAENLFDAACLAQSERMLTDKEKKRGDKPYARKVSCKFKDLREVPKAHYLTMVQYVLQNNS